MNCSGELEIMQIFGARTEIKICFSGSLFLIFLAGGSWFFSPTEPRDLLNTVLWTLNMWKTYIVSN